MSEPAKNFIRLRNGLKQIDENTLELRSRLTKIADQRKKISQIELNIKQEKKSIADTLDSSVSDLEVEGRISILTQNLQEQINSSIQSQKDSISENQKESKMLQEELSNHEAEFDRFAQSLRSGTINRFLKFTFLVFSLYAVLNWNLFSGFLDGTIKRVFEYVAGVLYIIWFFYCCALAILLANVPPPNSEKGKREAIKHLQEGRRLISQIDEVRVRIKGRKQSNKKRKKNIANFEERLKDLEGLPGEFQRITSSQEGLAVLQEEISLLAAEVLELEKENAEIWNSISDLIPSEFH